MFFVFASLLARVRQFLLNKFPVPLFQQPVYDYAVRLVYLCGLYRGKVDLCGHLRVVSHGSGYDARRDMVRVGDACPTVTGYIQRKGERQAEYFSELLQVPVYQLSVVAVLRVLRAVFTLDDWQEILRSRLLIFVKETLDVRLDVYAHLLPCLAPRIDYVPLADVRLSEVGEVYRGYAPQIE